MAGNMEPNADLEKILATLASLQPSGTQLMQNQEQACGPGLAYQGHQQELQHYPTQHNPPYHQSADPRLANRSASQHSLMPQPRPQDRVSTPLIDPATITDWKHGLRCVSKIAQQNPEFVASIRKLMKDQEGNVKQWEAGRVRLIEDQKLKRENESAHRAALSLPGLLENTPLLRTPEHEQAELSQYDAKVYRACKAMTEAQTSSLKVLGVPFFGTKHHLILHESEETPAGTGQTMGNEGTQKISKAELLELQRKMLNHLMELYGD